MKKILYITSIPWGWIKQRPQFLAEYLSTDFEVNYCYKRPTRIKKKDLLKNNSDLLSDNLIVSSYSLIPYHAIPFLNLLKLDWINRLLLKFQILDPHKYDIIWVTSASMYSLLPKSIKNQTNIVYDCMDDLLEFPGVSGNVLKVKRLMTLENELLKKSKKVICSAEYLKDKIVKRSGIPDTKVSVVNNAIELPKNEQHESLPESIKDAISTIKNIKLSMVYIGTIDKWFDFDSMLYALDRIDGLELVLFGPLRGSLPNNDKIHYLGTIPRDYIFDVMDVSDILVMPFKLNELIRSVNPVKLYEYIYSGKHVIATKYGETMKFQKFVHLYDCKEELFYIINKIQNGEYYIDMNENIRFINSNTWKNRYEIIKNVLDVTFI